MSDEITVRGIRVDLDRVYARMRAEAHRSVDGRLLHDRGLKYLLGEMYGLTADARTPGQPLLDLRRETASELRRRGWVAEVKRNSGRYELLR